MTADSVLDVRRLTVEFKQASGPVAAITDVDLKVPSGQFLVLIGPSGQGKSTLLKAIAGIIKPTSGEVLARGRRITGPSRDRGLVFQQDTVFPWMRVEDHIAYGLRARHVSERERMKVARRFLVSVGLESSARSWPKELSGGMRKRVAVATAFASDPSVLLMDEPFGSLDFVTRANLHEILLRLWQETQKTVVFVTHDVDETLLLADRVVVLQEGRIVDDIDIHFPRPRGDELRSDPEAIETRRLLLERLGLERRSLT